MRTTGQAAIAHPLKAPERRPATAAAVGAHRSRGWESVRIVVLAGAALYFAIPLYWLIVAATKSRATLNSSPALGFEQPQLWQNLTALFSFGDGIYLRWAVNSVLYALVAAALAMLICALGGYYLTMFRFRGDTALFNLVLGAVLIPSTALSLPLFVLFARMHLTNTPLAVVLPSIVSPFGLYLCKVASESAVPREIIEAARVDGAGEFRIFFTVAARLLSPVLVTVFLLQFVAVWNNFLLPILMLQNQDLYPITLGLYVWNGQAIQTPQMQTLVLAGSLVSVVPLIVCFLSLQRFWRSGLTTGGLKG